MTAGGLAEAGDWWVSSDKQYLFPVEVMGTLLRGKVMQMLHTLRASRAFDGFDDFRPPDGFDRLMRQLARSKWVVYAKKPFCRADHVLRYLGRYTHRVGLSNSRLVDVTENTVTFRTKDGQTVTLSPIEFLGRFLQHVLPPSFVKIRHFGLLAGAHVDGKLEQARQLLAPQDTPSSTNASPSTDELSWESLLRALNGKDVWRCPVCGAHVVRQIPPSPFARATEVHRMSRRQFLDLLSPRHGRATAKPCHQLFLSAPRRRRAYLVLSYSHNNSCPVPHEIDPAPPAPLAHMALRAGPLPRMGGEVPIEHAISPQRPPLRACSTSISPLVLDVAHLKQRHRLVRRSAGEMLLVKWCSLSVNRSLTLSPRTAAREHLGRRKNPPQDRPT